MPEPAQEVDQRLARQHESFAAVLREHPVLQQALADAAPDALQADLRKVWIASDYAAGLFLTDADLVQDLVLSGDLSREYRNWTTHLRDFLARLADPELDTQTRLRRDLRRYRKREWLRILWRDVTGRAGVMDTCRDLSLLADACINHALDVLADVCRQLHGIPVDAAGNEQQMIVLAMGKYGAYELNLSSDIDLIYVFPEGGETTVTPEWQAQYPQARSTTIQQYFSKLGQLLVNALDSVTSDGFVFRVDLRLRPYGASGALALPIDAIEEYYQTQGRDWERFAMIKVRAVSGDPAPVARLQTILRAFSYRRYLDFATIEALRDLKRQIEQQVRRKGMQDNIKLGNGGIREVEFIVQVLQLIYGGMHKHLQAPSILTALNGLVLEKCMPADDAAALRTSYMFLRRLEHAVQALDDKQTHAYPQDALAELRVALALGFDSARALRAEFERVREVVADNFADLIAPEADAAAAPDSEIGSLWQGTLDTDRAQRLLASLGYKKPEEVLHALEAWRASRLFVGLEKNGRERIERFVPLLLNRLAREKDPDLGFQRVFAFVQAVAQRTAYLVLLMENTLALTQLITLCTASPWVAELLTRYPVLLDELLRPLSRPPEKPQLQDLLRQQLLRVAQDALDEQLASLQNFKQEQMLTVAAAELAGTMPLMKVSDYLTWLAETVVEHVLELAWQQLTARYGLPFNSKGESGTCDFIVIGYGKLGGIELNYGSDLDLVFMHDGHADLQTTGGSAGAVYSSAFYVQLGQKLLSLLGTHTLTGKLYEIDLRLRPSGASGALVSSESAFLRYQHEAAWTWEHQALVRARVVAGSQALAQDFIRIRREVLGKERDRARLAREIVNMRLRMRRELGSRKPGETFQLKQDAGGLVDIEFMVQYLVLAYAHEQPALLEWTDNMRLLDTAAVCGVLTVDEAAALQNIYIEYRTLLHRLALDKASYQLTASSLGTQREQVIAIWDALFANVGDASGEGPAAPELS
ncbi:MAG TPA: bifunctional [glutamate--ammonia ligase]-adenylyl-L-tyrosine phosphorylase/[glutamate--ammonia-ligase] adenylyltransferase [Pseudomonadales bacterium]